MSLERSIPLRVLELVRAEGQAVGSHLSAQHLARTLANHQKIQQLLQS